MENKYVCLWVDDQIDDPSAHGRHVPEGWIGVKTPLQACRYIKTGKVIHIDFDHDLGMISNDRGGYLIARYIEKLAYEGKISRIDWSIHSANPVGRKNIVHAMRSAERSWDS